LAQYADLRSLMALLGDVMAPGGIFSFFNGLAPFNAFYNDIYCWIAREDLAQEGWEVHFEDLEIGQLGDEVWQGLRRKYWSLNTYRLPIAVHTEA